jgi:hypothetical protein
MTSFFQVGFSYVPAGWVVAALDDEAGGPRHRRVRVRHHRLTGRHSYSFVVVGPRAKHALRVKGHRRDIEIPEAPYRLRDQRSTAWICR